MPALSPAYGVYRTTAWEDLRFPAQTVNPVGLIAPPNRDTNDGSFLFDAANTEIIMGFTVMPHSWKLGTAIRPHIHWSPTTADTGNVLWRVDYEIKTLSDTFTGTYSQLFVSDAADGLNRNQLAQLEDIDMTGYGLAALVKWRVARVGGDVLDTYPADAKFYEFDIHIQVDGIGSFDPLKK